ncbi:hypothetical protein E4U42_005559 [Claviceps africana]|uniref:DUF8035 domain-containing protein n=1 Tax=Claviceps africana TaxID=83212 RepID=A0A8K0JBK0_9HYPO|nr:hypothetical protein E4U42_005559 [Claviceps africana]
MSQGAPLEHIDAVDAFARTLFVRVTAASEPLFAEVATAVRQLHIALRHLRVEAADPDSLLRSPEAAVYARQLPCMVRDCEHALKQLEAVLERWSATGVRYAEASADRVAAVTAVRSRLTSVTMAVDTFLDTIQLHNPASNAPEILVDPKDASLDHIKDKVDKIAGGLLLRRGTNGGIISDEHQMWQDFQSMLEMDGFSPHVLRQHKDVLRAYIRELQSVSAANGGAPPTVRGLLEHEATMHPSDSSVLGKEPTPTGYSKTSKQGDAGGDDERYGLSIRGDRRVPDDASPLISSPGKEMPSSFSSGIGGKQESASGHALDTLDSLALISTQDLVAMDDMNSLMASTHLHPASSHLTAARKIGGGSNPVPSGMAGSWPPPSHWPAAQPHTAYSLGPSPPAVDHQQPACYAAASSYGPRTAARLAPDRYGQPIPMDAAWTRVKRSLVSPEVLERAGVRYEARPDYVAILGRLSREQLAEYARQSAVCRAARSPLRQEAPSRTRVGKYPRRSRADSKSSLEDKDDERVLRDQSDSTDNDDEKTSTRRTKSRSYPFIVSPPRQSKTSSSAAVKPKPILKNKNENHVRFDPEPQEMESFKSPRSRDDNYDDDDDDEGDDGNNTHGRDRRRPRRPRESRASGRRDDRGRSNDHRSTRHADGGDRDHRRDRDRREERHGRRKSWGQTIGAVGIGGAAASLLRVLAEAAAGM